MANFFKVVFTTGRQIQLYTNCITKLRIMPRRPTRSRRMRGKGKIGDWLRKAHDYIKKNKLISRLATGYSMSGLPYGAAVGVAGKAAGMLGYGRMRSRVMMRRRIGGALRPA